MRVIPAAHRRYIEQTLDSIPFARWDRYVTWVASKASVVQGITTGFTITGWIDRADAYKDFVSLDFYPDRHVDFMTSSAKYSLAIYKILNDGDGRGHQKCKRVEHFFKAKNAIILK